MVSEEYRQALLKNIKVDPTLTMEERDYLTKKLTPEPEEENGFIHGLVGAGAGLAIAKFAKLSKTSQILLTMAGYGIGKYLLDSAKKHDKMIEFNDKARKYQLNV